MIKRGNGCAALVCLAVILLCFTVRAAPSPTPAAYATPTATATPQPTVQPTLAPQPLSVELDIPNYIPDAEALRHPEKFFSGEWIRLRGEFPPSTGRAVVHVEIRGRNTGTLKTLGIRRLTPKSITLEIPPEVPTDTYDLTLSIDKTMYTTLLSIHGLSQEDTKALQAGGEGAGAGTGVTEQQALSEAVLYHSIIDCFNCYWESVLAGHPVDSNLIVFGGCGQELPGMRDSEIQVSHDGARTWIPLRITSPFRLLCDPDSLVTPDGRVLLSGLTIHPSYANDVLLGILFQGDIRSTTLSATLFKDIPAATNPEALSNLYIVVDYPKVAYDSLSGTIYITGRVPILADGRRVSSALYISRDGGETFSEHPFDLITTGTSSSPVQSLELTREGILFAARSHSLTNDLYGRRQLLLMRFDEHSLSFIDVPGPILPVYTVYTRLPLQGRYWVVYTGPEIAIDKSARHPGRIYIVWAQPESVLQDFNDYGQRRHSGVNFDVYIAYSDDLGESWSEPIRVNDDETESHQVFPSISIDYMGLVHVAFVDTRNYLDRPSYDFYYAKIAEGTVSRNVRVNPNPINTLGGRSPGDYVKSIVGYPERAYISYPCTDSGSILPEIACVTAVDPRLVPLPGQFIRGDANVDLSLDVSDAISLLNWLFLGGERPRCLDAADSNDDGRIDATDSIYVLNYLFRGGPEPTPPFPYAGDDPTRDNIDCQG